MPFHKLLGYRQRKLISIRKWPAAVSVDEPCPLCDADLAHVSYVFGPRLPSHGRCIGSAAELEKIRNRKGDFTRYVVEVCATCRWHHLDSAEVL